MTEAGSYQDWIKAGQQATAELRRALLDDDGELALSRKALDGARQRQKDLLAEQLELESRPMGDAENARWREILDERRAVQRQVTEL